ncbi:major facilitator superfamily domain-containing protein [Aspergillus crustosus]
MATIEHQNHQGPRDAYHTPPQGLKEWLFLTALCSTQLFVQGAFGYILLPIHTVEETFGQDSDETARMTWHVGGYSLTVGAFIRIAGKLGDLYGLKRILVLGWTWFGVWSVIGGCSAFTHSAVFFDIARALQGIGPAFLLPNTLAIAGRTYPPGKKKNIIFSAFAMAAPLGCFSGGALGAALAQYVWWPWVTWISSIGCFPVRASFDYIVSLLGVTGLMLLNISWNQAPIDGWSTLYVYIILIAGFLILGLFVLQEKRTKDPILDVSIINPRVASVLVTTGLGWSSFGVWFYYLFQLIQHAEIRNVSPLDMDISFPASATILSDAVSVKHQGVSASLVNTVINYAMAIGLGVAGTVEAEVVHSGGSLLQGYRSALWTSVGLSALAFGVAFVYALCTECPALRGLGSRAYPHEHPVESSEVASAV